MDPEDAQDVSDRILEALLAVVILAALIGFLMQIWPLTDDAPRKPYGETDVSDRLI